MPAFTCLSAGGSLLECGFSTLAQKADMAKEGSPARASSQALFPPTGPPSKSAFTLCLFCGVRAEPSLGEKAHPQ